MLPHAKDFDLTAFRHLSHNGEDLRGANIKSDNDFVNRFFAHREFSVLKRRQRGELIALLICGIDPAHSESIRVSHVDPR